MTTNRHASHFARGAICIIAVFYAYGALVHVMNIASMTGFDWKAAPLKWQVLDLVYLLVDIVVVVGLLMRWRIGLFAFVAAALSQIVLYTRLRSWITDVPEEFRRSAEDLSYLDGLVAFHVLTLIVVALSVGLSRFAPAAASDRPHLAEHRDEKPIL